MKIPTLLIVLGFTGAVPDLIGAQVLAEIRGPRVASLELRGFELKTSGTGSRPQVRIDAKALVSLTDKEPHSTAWVLDANSREVVWNMTDADPLWDRWGLRSYEQVLELPPGSYEVYYATYPLVRNAETRGWWQGAARLIARALGRRLNDENSLKELGLQVRLVTGQGKGIDLEALTRARKRRNRNLFLSLEGSADSTSLERGFVLDRPLEIELYAVGELYTDGRYDYGWILNADTHEEVWRFTHEDSEPAGGAPKNRRVRQTLRLDAGRYAAFYVTDSSHSPAEWNALPPYDPSAWGLTLRVKRPEDRRYARTFRYDHLPGDRVIVKIVGLKNDECQSQGFTLTAPMKVQIYALGEGNKSGMADYGWMVDARTRRQVWSMEYERTTHGGGHNKNRLADEVTHLEPGSYIVTFMTNGSHAFDDWDTYPPSHPERWGITLFALGEFDPDQVTSYSGQDDSAILARIARARDEAHLRKDFTLEQQTLVAIYAVGEGTDGQMHDYGWIEDDDGQVVWKMTFAKTRSAGGSPKNRVYQGNLTLEAGEYTLRYQTDESHSYGNWNAAPPHDPDGWGIQIARIDEP